MYWNADVITLNQADVLGLFPVLRKKTLTSRYNDGVVNVQLQLISNATDSDNLRILETKPITLWLTAKLYRDII